MKVLFGAAALSFYCALHSFAPVVMAAKLIDIPLPVSKMEALELAIPADVGNGLVVFGGCKGCHNTGPSALNGVGPMLNGIVGRAAGGVPGYDYSSALAKAGQSGLVWTPYKLDAFLMAPSLFLAGNKMPFVGVKDETARRDLIGYLKTLR